jgi:glycosyltransferase involved in cell wall biosynthesis
MRICLYTETALPKMGGQEWVVDALARQFQNQGHDVIVLAPHPRLPLRARDRALPYPVARHPRFYSTHRFVAWYAWFLQRLHRHQRTQVLHCHGVYPAGYLAALTRAQRGIPTVITSHGGDIHPENVRLARPVIRARVQQSLAAADVLVSLSRYTEVNFRRLCPRAARIVTIPNGVDLSPYAAPAPRPPDVDPALTPGRYFLFLGRLKERKGVDVLLEAMSQWQPSAPAGIQLVLAGAGEERPRLEEQGQRLGLMDRIRFIGAVNHPGKAWWLQNALATVVPSRGWEAFPLVVLESLAAGTPVIGTRIPGLEELIEAGQTGWPVAPEAPGELARVLSHVWHHPREAQRLGRLGAERARSFSWEAIAQRHLELYEELTAAQRIRRSA